MNKNKQLLLGLISLTISYAAAANTDNVFNQYDNNISLITAYGTTNPNTSYNDALLGAQGTLFKKNIWAQLTALGSTSYQSIPTTVDRINSGFILGAKVGYGFDIANRLNIIPYGGLGYSSATSIFHQNSQIQTGLNNNDLDIPLGVKLELNAVNNRLKIALDTNLTYSYEAVVANNDSNQLLAHTYISNYYIYITPSIQWVVADHFNIEFFSENNLALTHNTPTTNNDALTSGTLQDDNMYGIKFGWLY